MLWPPRLSYTITISLSEVLGLGIPIRQRNDTGVMTAIPGRVCPCRALNQPLTGNNSIRAAAWSWPGAGEVVQLIMHLRLAAARS